MSGTVRVGGAELWCGDAREVLTGMLAESVHCCVCSPPYFGLRDYGHAGQIGLEATVAEYVEALVGVFREVCRVLRPDGTLWLNLGDSYAGGGGGNYGNKIAADHGQHITNVRNRPGWLETNNLKPKDIIGVPWMVAFALRSDGWFLRSDVVWSKPNPMPESVTDRPTKSHEYVFMLTKSARYFFDAEAVKEDAVGQNEHDLTGGKYAPPGQQPHTGSRKALHGPTYSRHRSSVPGGQDLRKVPDGRRNVRSVWTIATQPYPEAHFATMPPALAERCIKASCPAGGTVLDPFAGPGTTLLVAERLQRRSIGIELNPAYVEMAARRLRNDAPLFAEAVA